MTKPYKTQLATKSDCYKAGKKIKVKGLMIHSTGADNPYISRYVQPDDGLLGKNIHSNDWNRSGITKCVHGFIGQDTNGAIQAYQTLPWDYRAWGCGGAGNDMYIQVEICEDNLKSKDYFDKVYKKAVELFAYLALQYGLTKNDVLDHSEGHKRGVASNHGDVKHWFPKHGKSMDTFRHDIEIAMLGRPTVTPPKPDVKPPTTSGETYEQRIERLTKETLAGKHGNGDARVKALGADYGVVQARINGTKKPVESKDQRIERLVLETIRGKHGSGRERMISLGSDYAAVQQEVNKRLRGR